MVPTPLLDDWLRAALKEDIGTGDVTTELLIPREATGQGVMIAKDAFLVAGLSVTLRVFELLSPRVTHHLKVADGQWVEKGTVLLELEGPLPALLSGERVALNIFQHLCGVATVTRQFVNAVEGTGVKILDTRKTLPRMRILEKWAVRMGGGFNHRSSLSEGVLVKENHIHACGGIREAVQRIRQAAPHTLKIEIEASTLEEMAEALEAGVDMILLDNMSEETIREAVRQNRGRALLEVSGGVNLDNVRSLAKAGIHGISIGRLTHSAPAADISMLLRHAR